MNSNHVGGGLYYELIKINKLKFELNIERVYDISAYILLCILIIYSLTLLAIKKEYAPRIIIIVEAIGIVIEFVDFFFSNKDLTELLELLIVLIVGSLWILYFKYSKRVRNTYSKDAQ